MGGMVGILWGICLLVDRGIYINFVCKFSGLGACMKKNLGGGLRYKYGMLQL